MKSKGCGPYNLGAPKSPAKQVKEPVNPDLSESENEAIGASDQISDARAQKLKGLRGSRFTNMREQMQRAQRTEDSTYIVNNRTFNEPKKMATGMSGTVTLSEGTSRPSKFKRDKYGKMEKY